MRYLIALFVSAALPVLAMVGLGDHLGTLHADLTRLGQLSSHDFGRRVPPMTLPLPLLAAGPRPMTVVLGDSFSQWNQWQSHWMALRSRNDVTTFNWTEMGGTACLRDFARALHGRYPSAQRLVVEVVERSFAQLLMSIDAPCTVVPGATHPVPTGDGKMVDERPQRLWPPPDLRYSLAALRAEWLAFDQRVQRKQVLVTPLSRADLFTNRRSNRLLSFIDDELKRDWRLDTLRPKADLLRALQDELAQQGVALVVLVVPDKSTLYAPYFANPADRTARPVDAWALLDAAGVHQLRSREALQQRLPETRDLYLPDDTHLSLEGYRSLAAAVHAQLPD